MRVVVLAFGATVALASTSAGAQQVPPEMRVTNALATRSAHIDEWPTVTHLYSSDMVIGGVVVGLLGIPNIVFGVGATQTTAGLDSNANSPGRSPVLWEQTLGILMATTGGGLVATGAVLAIVGARPVEIRAHPDPPEIPYRLHNSPLLVGGIIISVTGAAVAAVGVGGWYVSHDSTGASAGIGCAGAGAAVALSGAVAIAIGTRHDGSDPSIVFIPRGAALRWAF